MKETLKKFINVIKSGLSRGFSRYNDKLPQIITIAVTFVIVVIGVSLFDELTENLKTEVLAKYDDGITQYIISYRSHMLTRFFLFVTFLGGLYGYLIVLAFWALLSAFVFKKWKYVVQSVLVLLLASSSDMILKRFVDRARPSIEHLVSVKTLSYPSGHAMGAMAFYGFLCYLICTIKMNKFPKIGIILILVLLIFSIGISRIYLGVHFPSDIVGGFIAGFIWIIFCVGVLNIFEVFRSGPNN